MASAKLSRLHAPAPFFGSSAPGNNTLATIFTIGFNHPDALRLLQEMRRAAPQHTFIESQDGLNDTPEPGDKKSSAVAIWCPRSIDAASTLITDSVAKGLPTLALLQEPQTPHIDFNSGHVEITFTPSNPIETIARIDLVLARARGPRDRNLITHGDLVIDQDRYEVRLAGRAIDLTYKEYELLKYIAARPGRVFSREALLRAVWDYDYFGGTRTVDVHVRRLRSKINDVRYQFIETVWNVGYRFRSGSEPVDP